jgi:hypothetical protein
MIHLNDIFISEKPEDGHFHGSVRARLSITSEVCLAFEASDELKQEARENVQRAIWHKLYGGQCDALLGLQHAIMCIIPADMQGQQYQSEALERLKAVVKKIEFPFHENIPQ